jgi:GNAT superfamily N-acetyltransferase
VTSTELTLRAAGADDAAAITEVFLQSRRAAEPLMPPPVHADHEVLAFHEERLARGEELWVAEQDGLVAGYVHLVAGWVDALYVGPGHTGQGIGSELLSLVKALRPGGFALWVFVSNTPARAFYRHHGLIELEHTDGSANEERSPDLRMAWPGEDPPAFFRAQLGEVDDELAVLQARRAALARATEKLG